MTVADVQAVNAVTTVKDAEIAVKVPGSATEKATFPTIPKSILLAALRPTPVTVAPNPIQLVEEINPVGVVVKRAGAPEVLEANGIFEAVARGWMVESLSTPANGPIALKGVPHLLS